LRRGEPCRRPRADAARAGDELAHRLPHSSADGLLAALVGVALDEGLAKEAGHLVVRQRARRLEVRGHQGGQVERSVLTWLSTQSAREQAGYSQAAEEGGHDHRVRAVGRPFVHG